MIPLKRRNDSMRTWVCLWGCWLWCWQGPLIQAQECVAWWCWSRSTHNYSLSYCTTIRCHSWEQDVELLEKRYAGFSCFDTENITQLQLLTETQFPKNYICMQPTVLLVYMFLQGTCHVFYMFLYHIETKGDRPKEEAGISLPQRLNTRKQLS